MDPDLPEQQFAIQLQLPVMESFIRSSTKSIWLGYMHESSSSLLLSLSLSLSLLLSLLLSYA
jgi:hypothetical protein